jgi:hypothetical protein
MILAAYSKFPDVNRIRYSALERRERFNFISLFSLTTTSEWINRPNISKTIAFIFAPGELEKVKVICSINGFGNKVV